MNNDIRMTNAQTPDDLIQGMTITAKEFYDELLAIDHFGESCPRKQRQQNVKDLSVKYHVPERIIINGIKAIKRIYNLSSKE